MAGKRISALTEQTGLSSGDFFGVDNAGQTASKKLNSEYFTKRFANVQNDTAFPTGDAYSSSSSYKVGDYVTHNDVLYRCKTACSAASWTVNATNFKEASLTKAVTDLNSALARHDFDTAIDISSYTGSEYIAPSDGYLRIGCAGTANAFTYGYVNGKQMVGISAPSTPLSGYDTASVFVRKGSKLKCACNNFSLQGAFAEFIPLI